MAIDPAYGIEWSYPQHFYFDFYVFQYATSVSASVYFADKILAGNVGDRGSRTPTWGCLKAGGSDYPVEVLKRAGLDMASPAPYRALVAKLRDGPWTRWRGCWARRWKPLDPLNGGDLDADGSRQRKGKAFSSAMG